MLSFFCYIFYGKYLGYGVKVQNLIWSAIFIVVSFGFMFSSYHCVDGTAKPVNAFELMLEGLFSSLMVFISFDLDVVTPMTALGKVLISIEGILGFITFGGVIAYIWRRMK